VFPFFLLFIGFVVSSPLRQGQHQSSGLVAERNKAMVQIEALRLFILSIDDKRVNGDFRPAGTLDRIPQQGASEFMAVIGESDGKASHARDGYCRVAWQAFGKPDWHLRKGHTPRSQCIEAGDPACRDLAGHEASGGAAPHVLAGLLPEIAVEHIHAAGKLRSIVAWPKWLYDEGTRHREDAIKRA
jgi:hypothetical protein